MNISTNIQRLLESCSCGYYRDTIVRTNLVHSSPINNINNDCKTRDVNGDFTRATHLRLNVYKVRGSKSLPTSDLDLQRLPIFDISQQNDRGLGRLWF